MRSVLTKERTAPIACDVDVAGNDRRGRRRGHGNVGDKLRRYSGEVESPRKRYVVGDKLAASANRREPLGFSWRASRDAGDRHLGSASHAKSAKGANA